MIKQIFVTNKAFEDAHGIPHNRTNPNHPDCLYTWQLGSVIEFMLDEEKTKIC